MSKKSRTSKNGRKTEPTYAVTFSESQLSELLEVVRPTEWPRRLVGFKALDGAYMALLVAWQERRSQSRTA